MKVWAVVETGCDGINGFEICATEAWADARVEEWKKKVYAARLKSAQEYIRGDNAWKKISNEWKEPGWAESEAQKALNRLSLSVEMHEVIE